jgi:CRP-like cAMP-binding protein
VQQAVDVLTGLSRSYLFEDLDRADLAALAAAATTRRLVRGEHLWQIGDPAEEILVVYEGEVKDSVVDTDGNEVTHFVHGPGMTFGEPGFFAVDRRRIVSVVALAATVLIRLDRRDLVPFMDKHQSIKDRALEGLASNTRWQSTLIASLFNRSLADRVALRLLELVDSGYEPHDGLPSTPRISQSTLAAMIGVSRENVNRALAALTGAGLIRQEKGQYVLLNEAALRDHLARDWPIAGRRDRRHRSLVRRPDDLPAVPARKPAAELRRPHGRGQPDPPPRQRGPRLLRQEDRRRNDRQVRAPRAQTQDQ